MTDKDNDKAEPQDEPSPEKKPAPKKRKRARRHRRAAALFLSLALIGVATAGAGLFYLWLEQREHLTLAEESFSQLHDDIDGLKQQQTEQREQLTKELQTLQEQQSNLGDAFSSLLKTSSHLRNDWLLTEAEYLIKLANHRLLLEQDINTAIVALQAADERLREVADPSLLKIRKRIAGDINALRAVPQPDLSGMSFTLSALARDVDQLPLATPDPDSMAKRAEKKQKTEVESWSELPSAIWRDIKSLVVIRHHDQPIQPLLSPEQRFFLTQNLKLQLEQARLALLKGDTKVFQERLQQTAEWVNTYFDTRDELTRHVLKRLQELADKKIDPEIPDISATFQALHDFRSGTPTDDTPQQKTETSGDKQDDTTPAENSKPDPSQQQDTTSQ